MMGWRRILDWIGDIWMICRWYHLDAITHISSRYHPHIVQISYFTTPQLCKKSSFNPYILRLLPMKTPLLNSIKTPLLIIQILPKYHPEIIQKSSRNHPEIIQKSSRYHPDIIQKSSRYHPDIIQISSRNHSDIILVKSQVLILVRHDYNRWKLNV